MGSSQSTLQDENRLEGSNSSPISEQTEQQMSRQLSTQEMTHELLVNDPQYRNRELTSRINNYNNQDYREAPLPVKELQVQLPLSDNFVLRGGVDTTSKTLTNIGGCVRGESAVACFDKVGPTAHASGNVELGRWNTPYSSTSLIAGGFFNSGSTSYSIPPSAEGRLTLNFNFK